MNHTSKNHHFTSNGQKFIVFTQSSVVTKPRISSLYDPFLGTTLKQGSESVRLICSKHSATSENHEASLSILFR